MRSCSSSVCALRTVTVQIMRAIAWLCAVVAIAAVCDVHAQAVLLLQPDSSASTLVGSGVDGHPTAGDARLSALGSPQAIAYDLAGNLYIADARNHQVLRVDAAGQLTIVAGTGRQGFTGDGGPAIAAEWNRPSGLVLDAAGDLFIADAGNHRVRRISAANGTVSTVAGTGVSGFSGDGAAAVAAQFRSPGSLAVSTSGELYIADTGNHRVRKVLVNGTVLTVAGIGAQGQDGDGGPASSATLDSPSALTVLPDGRLLIADSGSHRLRVLQLDGTIAAYPTGAQTVRRPGGLAADPGGSIYLADSAVQIVEQYHADGASPFAGSSEQGAFSAGAPLATPLNAPTGVAYRADGDLAIGDAHNRQVQRVTLPTLNFGRIPAGGSSKAQTLTLQNGGAAVLNVLAVTLPAGFSQVAASSTCSLPPFALLPAAQCVVAIAFTPVAQGPADAIARARVAGGVPHSVLLTGTAIASGTLIESQTTLRSDGTILYTGAPITLTAGVLGSLSRIPAGNISIQDGTTTVATATLTNGAATLVVASLSTGPHALRAVYSGDALYSGSSSPTLALSVVPAPDFTMTAGAASYSGHAGGTVTIPLTLLPVNGTLNHAVQLAVTGLPVGATATFAPAALTLGGDPAVIVLNVQMPATLAGKQAAVHSVAVATVLLFTGMLLRRRRAATLLAFAASLLCMTGCGSGFRAGITASDLTSESKTYSSVVTATTTGVLGSPLTHSASVGLVISK